MQRVLLLCPTSREYERLPAVAAGLNCHVIFREFAGRYFDGQLSGGVQSAPAELDILSLVEETISRCVSEDIEGVTSAIGYPGMPVASLIAERLGLPGTKLARVLLCEHKYYSRVAQQTIVPSATPAFQIVTNSGLDAGAAFGLTFPLFLKPVKSCFSINAQPVASLPELRRLTKTCRMSEGFLRPFNDLLKAYTNYEFDASCLLAETLLEGAQVSLEGYVYRGQVRTLGIVDAVMFPGTISFERFVYPSRLPLEVQARMKRIAEVFISGIGYDNALFNMELMYNPATGGVHIIEVNPKIASQFTDLFEKVDGTSSYAPLLQIALGQEPTFNPGQGSFKLAASCVLRAFTDARVCGVPTREQLAELTRSCPGARIEISVSAGQLLSDIMQDGKSFRYGLINLGANSEAELETKLDFCKNSLRFEFAAP